MALVDLMFLIACVIGALLGLYTGFLRVLLAGCGFSAVGNPHEGG